MTLMRNFNFLIGDLVSSDDPFWKLFIALKKLVEVIMDEVHTPNTFKYLEILIEEYLTQLNELLPKYMKPKHHYLIHYPNVMRLMGPLWRLSSMRFESRHQEGKIISRNSLCRINVCHTIAIKSQLKLNYRFLCTPNPRPFLTYGPGKFIKVSELSHFCDFKSFILETSTVKQLKWIKLFNKKISAGHIIIDFDTISGEPLFYNSKHFLIDDKNELVVIVPVSYTHLTLPTIYSV